MQNNNIDVITYAPDIDALRAELEWHFKSEQMFRDWQDALISEEDYNAFLGGFPQGFISPLSPHIRQDGNGYWIAAFMTIVHYKDVRSLAMMRLYPHAADGVLDEDSNPVQPSLLNVANLRNVVIEEWERGNCRDPQDDPREKVLGTSHSAEFVEILGTVDDGEGGQVAVKMGALA